MNMRLFLYVIFLLALCGRTPAKAPSGRLVRLEPQQTTTTTILQLTVAEGLLRKEHAHKGSEQAKVVKLEEHKTKTKTCGLRICAYGDKKAPRLFVAKHVDGTGHIVRNIIDGMVLAAALRMNFGGVLEQTKVHGLIVKEAPDLNKIDDHHHDMVPIMDALFGNNSWKEIFMEGELHLDSVIDNAKDLQKRRDSFASTANIYLPSVGHLSGPRNQYFTHDLRASLRHQLDSRPLKFAKNKVSIAIHVRRGEFGPGSGNILKDEYVYQLLEEILHKLHNVDIHLWSTAKSMPGMTALWKSSDFDGYRHRGVHVHLDEEDDLGDLWAHMARARIFIMSRSSFSYVPAVLNLNCVIRPTWVDDPLDNWYDGEDKQRKSYGSDFDACMSRAVDKPH